MSINLGQKVQVSKPTTRQKSMKEQMVGLISKIAELNSERNHHLYQLARAKSALLFYATKSNLDSGYMDLISEDLEALIKDAGKMAREALADLEQAKSHQFGPDIGQDGEIWQE